MVHQLDSPGTSRPNSPSDASSSTDSIYSSNKSKNESVDPTIYSSDPLTLLRLLEFNSQKFIRHGFHQQEEYQESLSKSYQCYWDQSPYKNIKSTDLVQIPYWTQPPKHRTACAALFLCLRLGFEPPDVVKASPAPNLEAWVNPKLLPKDTALESIAKRLQDQFESLAPTHARVKFKVYADVYAEEFKKTLLGLRKYSKQDRCLVYYNGHGVPKPTSTGEIWVFNKAYTQYIPIRLHDILTWVGTPVVFIWDCNNAGQILNHLVVASVLKDTEDKGDPFLNQNPPSPNHTTHPSIPRPPIKQPSSSTPPRNFFENTIQLAACKPEELLPRDPRLPADVFTSCLTSPIEMALRFYVLKNNSPESTWTSTAEFFEDLDKLKKVPGRMEMRRTPLGELTWIFTSIADAIAWNHLDRRTFTKIFRGDLVLAGTFRGFLLAERVMKSYGCTPMSVPKLPATHQSELWQTWDLEVDMCLSQLIEIWKSEAARTEFENNKHNYPPNTLLPQVMTYQPSTFFSQQLTAFEVWLKAVVAENQDENGDNDEDLTKARETLQWSCNDWSGVNMNKVEISDFSCSDPKSSKDKTSSVNLNGKVHHLSTNTSSKVNSPHLPSPGSPQHDNKPVKPAERPTRYKLPTFIKRFPLNSRKADDLYPPSPPQLPIVLQVLLSPLHRLRALILLCRLMDLGPWAVHLSLSIGIFQYVLKLLQAPAAELKPVLIFIWARILTVYPEGRQDLMRCVMRPLNRPEMPIEYFIKIMAPHSMELPIVNVVDHKAMCAFILSISCKNSRANSQALFVHGVLEIIIHRIKDLVPWQRQWYLILLAHMWEVSDLVKGRAIKLSINTILSDLLTDKVPEVRTAALYAFGTLIGVSTDPNQTEVEDQFWTPRGTNDGNQKPNENEAEPAELRNQTNSPVSKPSNLTSCQMIKLTSLSSANPSLTQLGYQEQISIEVGSAMACCHCSTDGSPMFRRELVVVLSALVDQHLGHFIVAAFEFIKQQEKEKSMNISDQLRKYRGSAARSERLNEDEGESDPAENMMTDRTAKLEKLINKLKADEEVHPKESLRAYLWMEYTSIYIVLLDLSLDPSDQVSKPAKIVVDYIHSRLMGSVLGRWLDLDNFLINTDTQNSNSVGTEKPSFDSKGQSFGRFGNFSHSNLASSVQSSDSASGDQKATHNINHHAAPHRSSTSVFTVNNLVPSFVRSSGWKTPFNTLSRSPEQSSLLSTDQPIRPSHDIGHNNDLKKSASSSPIVQSKTKTNPFLDRRVMNLLRDQSLESTIAKTRASDHTRRQIARSYPLQPPFSSSPNSNPTETDRLSHSSTTPNNINPSTSKPKVLQEENLEEDDYLYFLGLQHPKKLKFELNHSGRYLDEQPDGDHPRRRILPLVSNYYELSAHIFLKPKMTNSVGDSGSESICGSEHNEDHDDPIASQQQSQQQLQNKTNNTKIIVNNRNLQQNNQHNTTSNNSQIIDDVTSNPPVLNDSNLYLLKLTTDHDGLDNIKDCWRKQRNLKVILESPTFRPDPIPNDWSNLVCSFDHSKPINNLIMHPFEDQLIGSDPDGYINIYNWKTKSLLNRFCNSPERPSRITSLQLINQDSSALLLAGTPDGNLRIFRNFERSGQAELVTAFKGLPNNEPSRNGESGVVTDWQQSTGLLIVGGNSREIKVWNSRRESCIENIKTRSNSCLSSITTEKNLGYILVSGFGDGTIRIFDRRLPSKNSMVKVYRNVHNSWCSNIKFQDGNRRDLVSGDSTGLIALWDLRLDNPIHSFLANPLGLPVLDLHHHSLILATGSINGEVKLWDLSQEDDEESDRFYETTMISTSTTTRGGGRIEERNIRMIYNIKSNYNHPPSNLTSSSKLKSNNYNHQSRVETDLFINNHHHNNNSAGGDRSWSHQSPVTGLSFHPYYMMISLADSTGKLHVYSPPPSTTNYFF